MVVSIAIAGVYASEAGEITHDDSTEHVNGLYISGSGDVCHVSGYCDGFGDAPHIENVNSQCCYIQYLVKIIKIYTKYLYSDQFSFYSRDIV